MKPTVYIETTIISYLAARTSRDLVVAAHQQITQEWWSLRSRFNLYSSELVLSESSEGDPEAARLRIEKLTEITLLDVTREARDLASRLVFGGPLPEKAAADALHVAVAVVNGVDYLLTWNCAHLANATLRAQVEDLCRADGYERTLICTPEELMEELSDGT